MSTHRTPRPRGRARDTFALEARRLPPSQWPELDRLAWGAATSPAQSPFDKPGAAAHLAAPTLRARAGAWGAFIAFLASRGDLDPNEGPAARLTDARLRAWLLNGRERLAATTLAQQLRELSLVVAAMVPDRNWDWVWQHPLRPSAAEQRAARKPVVPYDAVELAAAALAECEEADVAQPSPEQARRYRDGLLLAFQNLTGLRRRNLAEITIGLHLCQIANGWILTFAQPKATKTDQMLELRVHEMLRAPLQTYLERHRPVLLAGAADHGRLWVNIGGRPLAYEALWGLFDRKGRALLGRPINPHLSRHTLATTLLTADPGDISTAAAALGHRGTRSVSEVYDRSGRGGADREWTRILQAQLRRSRSR